MRKYTCRNGNINPTKGEVMNWTKCSDRLPENTKPVQVFCRNEYGGSGCGKAVFIRKHQVKADNFLDEDWPEEYLDSYEEEFYAPQGWYEQGWEFEGSKMKDSEVTHWKTLPTPPKEK